MNEELTQDWIRYSSIWRNILIKVLEWSPNKADGFIQALRRELEESLEHPRRGFPFFYDLPSRYITLPILGDALSEKIWRTKGANPHRVYTILARAIAGGLEYEMEREDFDWNKARQRYIRSRQRVEHWLKFKERN
jgi:hypothetical protein